MARRENLAIIFQYMSGRSKEVSVFVDESGSFDSSPDPSRYYIVCLVFHDQGTPIAADLAELGRHLVELGLPEDHCVHAGPLIRREQDYVTMSRDERRLIFTRMLAFVRHLDITYRCFFVDKKFITKTEAIQGELLNQMAAFLLENRSVFDGYDKLKVYYDDGQAQVKDLLKSAFAPFSSKTEFVPEVAPERYRLFQAADLLCTLELTRIKLEVEHQISVSEKKFFVSIQNLKKHYLKQISSKCWGD